MGKFVDLFVGKPNYLMAIQMSFKTLINPAFMSEESWSVDSKLKILEASVRTKLEEHMPKISDSDLSMPDISIDSFHSENNSF